jgi:hypothetical protein
MSQVGRVLAVGSGELVAQLAFASTRACRVGQNVEQGVRTSPWGGRHASAMARRGQKVRASRLGAVTSQERRQVGQRL